MLHRMLSQTTRLIPLLMIMMLTPSFSEASTTIRNIPPTPHQAAAGTSLAELGTIIRIATNERNWQITDLSPGLVHATLLVRNHKAMVAIGFDESNFWIDYRDSVNLDYRPDGRKIFRNSRSIKGPRIHKNYNFWVKQLAESIVIRAKSPLRFQPTHTPPSANPLLIAEELEKLDALRKRGILTQQEFDHQKAKLLAR